VNCFAAPTLRPDLSPSFLQSNCQSASTTTFAREPFAFAMAGRFRAELRASNHQGPVRFRCPAVDAIFTARAAPTTTPCYPDSTSRRHPVSQAGDEIRHKVPYLARPYDLADSDILAITELREGVFTNLPGETACLRRPLLQDFERRPRPRSLFRRLHPGCLPSNETHCWVSCYPQVVANLWMDEVPASAGTSQEKTPFSPWISGPSP